MPRDRPERRWRSRPTEGIEWRRNDKTYIARGNATAVRGDLRVRANTLTARYRDKAGGDNEIYQIEADGGVVLTQPGRTIYGNHAVYNLDSRTLTLTGGNLRVVTAKETVTARDQLEYRERERIVIAQGEVMVESGARRIGADMMTGHFDRLADGSLSLARIEAEGNITVKTKDTFARSQKGDYDLGQDIMTLTGRCAHHQRPESVQWRARRSQCRDGSQHAAGRRRRQGEELDHAQLRDGTQ